MPVFRYSAEPPNTGIRNRGFGGIRYFAACRIVLYACPSVRYLGHFWGRSTLQRCGVGCREYRACGSAIPAFRRRRPGVPDVPHPWKHVLPKTHSAPRQPYFHGPRPHGRVEAADGRSEDLEAASGHAGRHVRRVPSTVHSGRQGGCGAPGRGVRARLHSARARAGNTGAVPPQGQT